ncbi:MAG: hypothetical protein LC772_02740 [Chloroflexi bacterium]|nr:hypothetical protein [Chloroflexota bacterium]
MQRNDGQNTGRWQEVREATNVHQTAVRQSMMFPTTAHIRWPEICSGCGREGVAVRAATMKRTPPLPYCVACHRVYRRWTRWIRFWVGFALLVDLGPLLFMGATLDRPMPSLDSYHNLSLLYIDVVFFTIVLSVLAAAIGYLRRSELQGIHIHAVPESNVDDPTRPLDTRESWVEVRFKNSSFYSATLDANRPG